MKTEKEIQEMCDKAADAAMSPRFFGQSYEEGVRSALEWVLGEVEDDEDPLS